MDTMNEIEKVPQVVQSTVYNALSGTKSMKVETLLYICEGCIKQLSRIMDMYGYYEANGWWLVKNAG